MRALAPLSPGTEVAENYGPVFYFKDRLGRRAELSGRYWFDCECQACKEDWPLLKENTVPRWRPGEPGGPGQQAELEDLATLYQCGADFLEHGQTGDAADSLTEYLGQVVCSGVVLACTALCIVEVYQLVDPPLETAIRAEDKLRTCYNNEGTVVYQDSVLKINPEERRVAR